MGLNNLCHMRDHFAYCNTGRLTSRLGWLWTYSVEYRRFQSPVSFFVDVLHHFIMWSSFQGRCAILDWDISPTFVLSLRSVVRISSGLPVSRTRQMQRSIAFHLLNIHTFIHFKNCSSLRHSHSFLLVQAERNISVPSQSQFRG
jgi:hypothetical protein